MLYNPRINWNNLNQVFEEFDRLWAPGSETPGSARLNVWSTEDGARLQVELPGVLPDSIELSANEDELTITGQKPDPVLGEGDVLLKNECRTGKFERVVKFPFRINSKKVKATCKDGILTIEVAKSEQDKPKKITINAA